MLHFLLEQDPHLLECLDRITAADSPVHIAARKGNTTFVLEIVSLKPSLARKLNQHGLSPIHLALQEGQTQTVIGLMRIDSELIRLRGKDGITPLHYVAEMGDVVLLSKFLRSCPSSIHDLTVHCQTAVHIAVKKKKLAAFEFLFGWLHRRNMEEILNWKDDEGNTVLHIAVQENEPRAVQLLINNVDIDVRNLDDKTVVNIFDSQGQSQNSKIKQILSSASSFSRLLNSLVRIRDTYLGVSAENENPASDVRDIILVVAVLIATATYQAVLSPPGGFWGDNYDPPGNTTNASVIDGQQKPHRAGTIIMDGWESSYFALLNSAAFCASVSTIIILMMGLPFALLLVGSTVFISFSYFFSLHTIFPALDGITVFLLSLLGAILFSVHVLEFEVHRRQRERRRVGILY
ncbi:hypothetical protein P3X46_029775 [Hevea brasiliensis]|uniref:PGG domain-containing protein n=1 Tax=Hevea brasiliensis TaxID=3981 RepID=A0ABQ9KTA1_HEVBR|nr:hypothetical protein P3X46_029775 [Hevea brasiliensis]